MRRKMTVLGAGTFFVAALFMWGCSDDDQVTNPSGDEARLDAMEATAEDFGAALAGEGEGMLRMWAGPGSGGFGIERDPAAGILDDTTVFDWNGFHGTLIRNYYDTTGVWSLIYDPATTVRMERKLWIDGTWTNQSGRRTVTLDHFDSTMVWWIQPWSEVFTLQGSGEREVEAEFSSRFRQNVKTFIADYAWTLNDLEIARDREAQPYPLDRSIAVTAVVTRMHQNPGRDYEVTTYLDFVVHFDGTEWAHVVFADGTEYWIDLDDGWCYHDHP